MKEFVIEQGVLKQYTGNADLVVVPDGICEIGYRAFYHCVAVRQVVLPAGVTKIDSQAFLGCIQLTAIQLPEGLTEIGYSAFEGCVQLAAVHLPEGLRQLDRMVFLGCTALAEISFPDSLQSVGRDGLSGTAWLAQQADGVVYAGKLALFCKGMVEAADVRPGTTKLCVDAFRGCDRLLTVTLPDSLQEIEDRAFQYCRNLQQIVIPQQVTRIGSRAFAECPRLQAVLECVQVTIGKHCFADTAAVRVTALSPSDLPDNIRQSAILAFADAVCGHQRVEAHVYQRLLQYLQSRRKLLYPLAIAHWNLLQVMLQAQIIPLEDVEGMLDTMLAEEQAEAVAALMQYKQSLTAAQETDLSDSWEALSLDWGCSAPEQTAAELLRLWGVKKNRDGTATLLRYHGMEAEVTVPSCIGAQQITTIAAAACSPRRYGLKRESAERLQRIAAVHIMEGILIIGPEAFADCQNLRQVTLPESIVEIGSAAFQNCGKLTELVIPRSVEKIGKAAFAGCVSLQTVYLPQGVQIAADSFAGCSVQYLDDIDT